MFIIINKFLFNVHRPCYKKVIVQIKIKDFPTFVLFSCNNFSRFAVNYRPVSSASRIDIFDTCHCSKYSMVDNLHRDFGERSK